MSYGLKDHYLRKQSFDIGLVEQYDFCGFGLFQALNITKIFWLSAIGVYSGQAAVFGVDYPLSYMPGIAFSWMFKFKMLDIYMFVNNDTFI